MTEKQRRILSGQEPLAIKPMSKSAKLKMLQRARAIAENRSEKLAHERAVIGRIQSRYEATMMAVAARKAGRV
jgi:hypothetical protein